MKHYLVSITHHHSQVNTSWLKMVPLGQRKETGTRAWALSGSCRAKVSSN